MAQTFLFKGKMFVWLDETGTDKRDQLREYGYAFRGFSDEETESMPLQQSLLLGYSQ